MASPTPVELASETSHPASSLPLVSVGVKWRQYQDLPLEMKFNILKLSVRQSLIYFKYTHNMASNNHVATRFKRPVARYVRGPIAEVGNLLQYFLELRKELISRIAQQTTIVVDTGHVFQLNIIPERYRICIEQVMLTEAVLSENYYELKRLPALKFLVVATSFLKLTTEKYASVKGNDEFHRIRRHAETWVNNRIGFADGIEGIDKNVAVVLRIWITKEIPPTAKTITGLEAFVCMRTTDITCKREVEFKSLPGRPDNPVFEERIDSWCYSQHGLWKVKDLEELDNSVTDAA